MPPTNDRATMPALGAMISLHDYMAHCLDATQRETRANLQVQGLPPSGRGSDRATIRVQA